MLMLAEVGALIEAPIQHTGVIGVDIVDVRTIFQILRSLCWRKRSS